VTIERVRSFWNAQPCDSTLDEDYVRYRVQPHIYPFADFSSTTGKRILEIGCGIGTDTEQFNFWNAKHTVAVDLSIESIKIAKERLGWCKRITFLEANAEELSHYLTPQPFDIIYSFGVIHHSPNPERIFQQLTHYCDVNTELRIMLYAKWSLRSLYVLLFRGKGQFWNFSEILRSTAETQYGCPVAYFYSFKQVRELMKDYKITSIRKAYIRGLPDKLSFLEKWFGGNILINARLND